MRTIIYGLCLEVQTKKKEDSVKIYTIKAHPFLSLWNHPTNPSEILQWPQGGSRIKLSILMQLKPCSGHEYIFRHEITHVNAAKLYSGCGHFSLQEIAHAVEA